MEMERNDKEERNMKSNLKWMTKRVLLKGSECMPSALPIVLVDFVDKLKSEKRIKRWYTSLKGDNGDNGPPSFRIYLEINKADKFTIQEKFDTFLHNNTEQIGWNGDYFSPDPGVDSSYLYLAEIHLACELVLRVVKQYPDIDQRKIPAFWNLVTKELRSHFLSIGNEEHSFWHFIHFVANNLCLKDDDFLKMCLISNS